MSGRKINDSHTIYAYIGNVPITDVERYVKMMHKRAGEYIKREVDPRFKNSPFYKNIPSTRDGRHGSICCLWVKDPRIYYILVGLNPDGSDRVEKIIDPTYVPDEDDWGALSNKYITTQLPPILEFPPLVTSNGEYTITYNRFQVDIPPSNLSRNKIVCERIDSGEISDDMITKIDKIMKRYSTFKVDTKRLGTSNRVMVNFFNYDAMFPLAMVKIFKIEELEGMTIVLRAYLANNNSPSTNRR